MTRLRFLALLLVASVASGRVADSTSRCILLPDWLKSDSTVYWVVEALPDSTFVPGRGKWADTLLPAQQFRVLRRGGTFIPPELQQAATISVLPWFHDQRCGPDLAGQAIWVTPGRTVFINPSPRFESAASPPVLDAYTPVGLPYEVNPANPMAKDSASTPTADELFDFYEVLPTARELRRLDTLALGPALGWIDQDPRRRRISLLRLIYDRHLDEAADGRKDRVRFPMLGTWRISVKYPNGDSAAFLMRTSDGAHQAAGGRMRDRNAPLDPFVDNSMGGAIWAWAFPPDGSPPTARSWRERLDWPLDIAWRPDMDGSWRAAFELWEFRRKPRADAYADSLFGSYARWSDSLDALDQEPSLSIGRIAREGASWTFAQSFPMGPIGVLEVTGVRIDSITIHGGPIR